MYRHSDDNVKINFKLFRQSNGLLQLKLNDLKIKQAQGPISTALSAKEKKNALMLKDRILEMFNKTVK